MRNCYAKRKKIKQTSILWLLIPFLIELLILHFDFHENYYIYRGYKWSYSLIHDHTICIFILLFIPYTIYVWSNIIKYKCVVFFKNILKNKKMYKHAIIFTVITIILTLYTIVAINVSTAYEANRQHGAIRFSVDPAEVEGLLS